MRKGRPVPVLLFALLVLCGFVALHLWLDDRANQRAREHCAELAGTWNNDMNMCEVGR